MITVLRIDRLHCKLARIWQREGRLAVSKLFCVVLLCWVLGRLGWFDFLKAPILEFSQRGSLKMLNGQSLDGSV